MIIRRLCVLMLLGVVAWCAPPDGAGLLLISIDGLNPDYVTHADRYGLKIPNLRRILHDGSHASGVRGVLPTVTYPTHTAMLTGVAPAKHGIYSNLTFDPMHTNLGGWYWYSEDVQAPTIWQAAAKCWICGWQRGLACERGSARRAVPDPGILASHDNRR